MSGSGNKGPSVPDGVSGFYRSVLDNETLPAIAKSCNVDLQLLAKVNNLTPPFALKSGTKLFIPNGEKSEAWPSKAHAEAQPIINDNSSDQLLYWPLRGKIISSFHAKRGDHGITIEAPEGTSVHAAGSGKIGYVGTMPLFGNVVLVEHTNRLVTIYGHLQKSLAKEGSTIKAGALIGTVGTSGRVNKPALYFGVTSKSNPVNPLLFLEPQNNAQSKQKSRK